MIVRTEGETSYSSGATVWAGPIEGAEQKFNA
jgi:hypothetical protein